MRVVASDSAAESIDQHFGSMISLFASVCIEAPATEVWAGLSKLEDIRVWSETVVDARCEGPIARGVGAERTCDLIGGITIKGKHSKLPSPVAC